MPRRKRFRKPKKQNSRNIFSSSNHRLVLGSEDGQMRTCIKQDASLDLSAGKIVVLDSKAPKRLTPDLELNNELIYADKIPSPSRKRRSCSRSSVRRISDPSEVDKLSQSSPSLSLSRAGPDLVHAKGDSSTQTIEERASITDTPRISHEALLDLDYEAVAVHGTPLAGYQTPLKRMRLNELTQIFDVKDTAMRIQDLNNLHWSDEIGGRKDLNCSRVFNGDSLKRLQKFNDIILNTSQSFNEYDGENQEEIREVPMEGPEEEPSGTEISFFTPQLYNGKSASTPIEKCKNKSTLTSFVEVTNKVEIVQCEVSTDSATKKAETFSVGASNKSTQFDRPETHHISVQTSFMGLPAFSFESGASQTCVSVTKRRTYKSFPASVLYYRVTPKKTLRFTPRVVVEKSTGAEAASAVETCVRIMSQIKKYHRRYSAKLPGKIMEICSWLGLTIRKGVTSLYKLYTERRNAVDDSSRTPDIACTNCHSHLTQITALTANVDNLTTQIKQLDVEKTQKLSTLQEQLDLLKHELAKLTDFKKELKEIKEKLEKPSAAAPPPPPPPPPPPMFLPAPIVTPNITKLPTKKKKESARPIISLDDILKVKLRKIGDRPSPLRRSTEPIISHTVKQFKLRSTVSRAQTPTSSGSTLSNSPRSSLMRLLTETDRSNVGRVKRLQRRGPYKSFDDFSRTSPLSRRERAT